MKNRGVAGLAVAFSIFFLFFVFKLTSEISNTKKNILQSPNVIDVTDVISTKFKISKSDFPAEGSWSKSDLNDDEWERIKIPSYQIIQNSNYSEESYAYYRIKVPKEVFSKLNHLQNETFLALQYIYFNKLDIIVNGKLYRSNKPKSALESLITVPLIEGKDNVVAIKGLIKTGDTGIDHRDPIILGRGAEVNEVYRAGYKGSTVFPLIFILCKGSILFIFGLIYLLVKVDSSFEKFLIFGLCVFIEELIAADYLYGPLNFNQMVYLYNLVNLVAIISVYLFFTQLMDIKLSKNFKIYALGLGLISAIITVDAVYWNAIFSITTFMKFWNVVLIATLLRFILKIWKFDKLLFFVICISLSLYAWSTFFSVNVGLNMKAYGNLLLFFLVAYQTFILFRKEQLQLQLKEKQLLEQEKDVAIGKAASLLAHDVRKPLELMKLLFDRLSTGEVNNEFLEVARKDIDFSMASVSNHVNEIMNFGLVSKVDLKEVSFYKILAGSIKQVMTLHPDMDLNLEYRFNANKKILGEESRLSSALVNLISNSVEAIKDIGNRSTGKIDFATEIDNGSFIFKISNDGPSIPEHLVDQIFKPLFTHGKANGTGLGLASVMKAVNEHDGEIKVLNIGSNGVEFTLSFKLGLENDEAVEKNFLSLSKLYDYSDVRNKEVSDKKPLRVFVLDDEVQVIQYLQFIVAKLPYEVTLRFASDVESAEEIIKNNRFDVYILDHDLNLSSTGIDFYLKHLSFLGTEVIIHSSRDLGDEFRNLKCHFFSKPLSFKHLVIICDTIYSKRLRILLVDDTKLIRIAWQNFHGSHNIQIASSPEEALMILGNQSHRFECCVLDYHFDNSPLNGGMLAKKIIELRNEMKVLISSNVDQKLEGFISISKRDFDVRKFI